MQHEELFIGGYILRRDDEKHFEIEHAPTGYTHIVTEKSLAVLLGDLWRSLEA